MDAYYLTRLVFQRALALVYLIAFIIVVHQFLPLLGEKGLLPAPQLIKFISFGQAPSIFFFFPNDFAFMLFGWIGVLLSLLALAGVSERFNRFFSILIWTALWVIYLSFVNIGFTFYSFGWESMLLEAGFLAIFLGPSQTTPSMFVIYLLRWVLFRDMFGAGLIKIRGDACWRDLTCLFYHYETQPMPNPLSWYSHQMPLWIDKGGVLFNHFVELVVPFFYFAPQPAAAIAGLLTMFFQGTLMLSGNFAFLNFLTIVLAISTLHGPMLRRIVPFKTPLQTISGGVFYTTAVWILVSLVSVLSIPAVLNLLSPQQIMNTSFEPLHLVNTYGAFGSITKTRNEIIIEGTDEGVITNITKWKEYEFIGKPGDPKHMPPQIAPYHLRLDWLMWFAAFRPTAGDPWFFHLIEKLLLGDKAVLSLLRTNPFLQHPPKYVRAFLYEYHFTTWEEKAQTGDWWKRKLVGTYFPEVSLDNPDFQSTLKQFGW